MKRCLSEAHRAKRKHQYYTEFCNQQDKQNRQAVTTYRNSVQHLWRKNVHACINLVGHEYLRLLDKALDLTRRLVVHHNTVLRRLFHLGHLQQHDGQQRGLAQTVLLYMRPAWITTRKVSVQCQDCKIETQPHLRANKASAVQNAKMR